MASTTRKRWFLREIAWLLAGLLVIFVVWPLLERSNFPGGPEALVLPVLVLLLLVGLVVLLVRRRHSAS